MIRATVPSRLNLDIVESFYKQWQQDPTSVDESWQQFFEGFELGVMRAPATSADSTAQTAVTRLIYEYRDVGHFLARVNPLADPPPSHPLLKLSAVGLDNSQLDKTFDTRFLGLPAGRGTLRELVEALKDTYCRSIGVEYMHIQDTRIRQWLQQRMEPIRNRPQFARRKKLRILMNLHYAEMFERFLQTSYVGQKRFSLEGSETLIPLLDAVVNMAADDGVKEIVLGMAHRGRLNVLANILDKPLVRLLSEFEDTGRLDSWCGDGDVKYHLGFSNEHKSPSGNSVHITLTPNPSHLESVNPVVEGRTRAKQRQFGDKKRRQIIPVLIHGDAAFAGQGLVAETLNLSGLDGFHTGGTVHIIINNQIGFTTSPKEARSTCYCTDVAKMIEAPIFHVNGDDPEATVFVAELAFEFRQTFGRDVVVDMFCYRRHGHNEGDEPSFTQPLMYERIEQQPGAREVYTEELTMSGSLTIEESEALQDDFQKKLDEAKAELERGAPPLQGMTGYEGHWEGFSPQYSHEAVDTTVEYEILSKVVDTVTTVPEGFNLHPKLQRQLKSRREKFHKHEPVDWALAEMLAFGSLLLEGTNVRLSGQDSQRGTFSQRHASLLDTKTGKEYMPLEHLDPDQGACCLFDSTLSEAAVLGFEFGYSLDSPRSLVMWEAQFGDFANGAQVIIDQFIVCSQSKWQRDSGIVLLLPHGYEGQGPEHSSARLERFLQMCAEDNIQVCNPTTPAQYFHLLRRQVKRNFRKPLIVMTPKSLLRHKTCVSDIAEFAEGSFAEVLDDPHADPETVQRVIICSGKVYYDILAKRNDDPVAIIRLEQFYPFREDMLTQALDRYENAEEIVWVQEESSNMGGLSFMTRRLRDMGHRLRDMGYEALLVSRDASASPATGSHHIHRREQDELVEARLPCSFEPFRMPRNQNLVNWKQSWPLKSKFPPLGNLSPKASCHVGSKATASSFLRGIRCSNSRRTKPHRRFQRPQTVC